MKQDIKNKTLKEFIPSLEYLIQEAYRSEIKEVENLLRKTIDEINNLIVFRFKKKDN
jgi:hypothetical protein